MFLVPQGINGAIMITLTVVVTPSWMFQICGGKMIWATILTYLKYIITVNYQIVNVNTPQDAH